MNLVPETPYYEVPSSQSSAGFRDGQNVDIVGVTGSIPVTPTIRSQEIQGFQARLTYCPSGSTNLDRPISALFVETNGAYFGLLGIDPWDEARDARKYAGPHPVVAHPPCQRWGRFWHGSTRKPHQFKLGEDSGCFAAALEAVTRWGGVIEHPADSRAWAHFGLPIPKRGEGWTAEDFWTGRSCYVEQGHYGHASRKPTWLYAVRTEYPELDWSRGAQRIPQWMIDRYGYEKARRIGVVAMIGGKDKTRIRNATPEPFRDLLVSLARTTKPMAEAA